MTSDMGAHHRLMATPPTNPRGWSDDEPPHRATPDDNPDRPCPDCLADHCTTDTCGKDD